MVLLLPFIACLWPIAAALVVRQSITELGAAEVAAFTPYSNFAAAAYCPPNKTATWSCGALCNANSDFKSVASGGDGSDVQFWYVGYSPSLKKVIVGHQGTNTSEMYAILTDADFFLDDLDDDLFPGFDDLGIKAHNGFIDQHAKTAESVLAAVKTAMSTYGTSSITTVGHSLGAALSQIEAVYLSLHLKGASVNTIGYGVPRVGNQEWADYLDAHLQITHVNNKEDIVPILPGRFLGFHHPSGEVHIDESGEWLSCPGQDNTDDRCSTGDVRNIFDGEPDDHGGPYNGVHMGSVNCS
ncbi:Alpha/Beta hydrolase protein [Schizophyllum commune]